MADHRRVRRIVGAGIQERFKASSQPPVYTLMAQVWLSPSLAAKRTGAFIERRTKVGGDGSDHDPAWVALNIRSGHSHEATGRGALGATRRAQHPTLARPVRALRERTAGGR
jgi:hypothetical protein